MILLRLQAFRLSSLQLSALAFLPALQFTDPTLAAQGLRSSTLRV